jgi:hypothetical protein
MYLPVGFPLYTGQVVLQAMLVAALEHSFYIIRAVRYVGTRERTSAWYKRFVGSTT